METRVKWKSCTTENIAIGERDPSEPMNWQCTDKPSLPDILVYSTMRCQQLQNPYQIILGCKEVSRRRSIGTSVPTMRISLWRPSSFHSATRLVPQHLGHVCLELPSPGLLQKQVYWWSGFCFDCYFLSDMVISMCWLNNLSSLIGKFFQDIVFSLHFNGSDPC